jgi:hypothetical protein
MEENKSKCKLYLNVDGVLLTSKNTRAADGAEKLIDYVLSNYDCYWLTTHCRDGNCNQVLSLLTQYFSGDIMEKLKKIKPTKWDTLKTEGIDLNSHFYWLDDYVFEAEKKILDQHCRHYSLILVNLDNENELLQKIRFIENQKLAGLLPWTYHFKKDVYSMSFKERLLFNLGVIRANYSFKNLENMSREELIEAIKHLKKPWWNFLFFWGY